MKIKENLAKTKNCKGMRITRDVLEVVCGFAEPHENIEAEKTKEEIPLEFGHPSMTKVLFVPSTEIVQPQSNVGTIGFPGTESLTQELKLPTNYANSFKAYKKKRKQTNKKKNQKCRNPEFHNSLCCHHVVTEY